MLNTETELRQAGVLFYFDALIFQRPPEMLHLRLSSKNELFDLYKKTIKSSSQGCFSPGRERRLIVAELLTSRDKVPKISSHYQLLSANKKLKKIRSDSCYLYQNDI